MRTSRRMLKQVRRAMVAAFLFSGCINLLMLVTPVYTLQVFETVVPLGSIETLVILTAFAAVAILAQALIEMARDNILLRASVWLDHELGQHILENGVKLAIPGHELARDQQALKRFTGFLGGHGLTPLFDAPWAPLFIGGLFLIHPLIGGVALASALLLVAAAGLENVLTSRLYPECAGAEERSERWWLTIARNAPLAGALGLARGAAEQWEFFNRAHAASRYSIGKRVSAVRALSRAVRIGAQIALYGIGAYLVVGGELSPGALVAAAILVARALAPLENLVASLKAIGPGLAAYTRLKALPSDAQVPRLAGEAGLNAGRIVISDLSVYHPGRQVPALRGVSFALEPGECLGIVGSNGSGKSTLAAVLAGAIVPSAGAASLDGIPIAKWQRGDGAPPIGYLSDDLALIEGTVHENIARFTETSVMSVARAALKAGVHDVLHGLPQGYDTAVGVAGQSLSLSERRAVGLARAVFGAPRIVVLDEPEIGLDGTGLKRLTATLSDLKAAGTALIVATQDPRLLSLMSKVAVLNGGALMALGSPADVRRKLETQRSGTAAGMAGIN